MADYETDKLQIDFGIADCGEHDLLVNLGDHFLVVDVIDRLTPASVFQKYVVPTGTEIIDASRYWLYHDWQLFFENLFEGLEDHPDVEVLAGTVYTFWGKSIIRREEK